MSVKLELSEVAYTLFHGLDKYVVKFVPTQSWAAKYEIMLTKNGRAAFPRLFPVFYHRPGIGIAKLVVTNYVNHQDEERTTKRCKNG